jgi:hypothetical protein
VPDAKEAEEGAGAWAIGARERRALLARIGEEAEAWDEAGDEAVSMAELDNCQEVFRARTLLRQLTEAPASLPQDPLAAIRLDKPLRLYTTASALDEYRQAPAWAKIVGDQALLDAIVQMRARLHGQR